MGIPSIKKILYSIVPPKYKKYLERIENSPLGYRLARGAFWSLTGTAIARALQLLGSVLVARLLGKTGYGEFGIIQTTIGMFGVFAGFGMGISAAKHTSEFRNTDKLKTGRIIGLSYYLAVSMSAFVAIFLFFFADWLSVHTLNSPNLGPLLKVSSLLLFFNAVNGAQTGVLTGFEAFKQIASINFFSGLMSFPLLVGGCYWEGLSGAVWGLVLSSMVTWFFNHSAILRETKKMNILIPFKGLSSEWPMLWKFNIPMVLASSMVGPVNWVCGTLLVNRPNGYAEMGVFNAANQWYVAFLFFPTIISQAAFPMMSEQLGINKRSNSLKIMFSVVKMNLVICVPLLGLLVFSRQIMGFYGEDFSKEWLTLALIFLTASILSFQIPIGQFIAASGKIWAGFWMNFGWAGFYMFFSFEWVGFGSKGIASARLVAYLFHFLWTTYYAIQLTKNPAISTSPIKKFNHVQ